MKALFVLIVAASGAGLWTVRTGTNPLSWFARIPKRAWLRHAPAILAGYATVYVAVAYLNVVFTAHELRFLDFLRSPVTALLFSILVTVLLQASFITEFAVVFAAARLVSVPIAVALVLGGNVGTCITNTVVAFANLQQTRQFERAFAASIVHDLFNLFMVLLIFPGEVTTQFFSRFVLDVAARLGATATAAEPALLPGASQVGGGGPALLVIVAVLATIGGILLIVFHLKSLFVDRITDVLASSVFVSRRRSVACGVSFTFLVQSSSLSTSMIVPLVGSGAVPLREAFYYLLGCNVGTAIVTFVLTLPVILTGSAQGTAVALTHLLFNGFGVLLFSLLPPLGEALCSVAEAISSRVSTWSRVRVGVTLAAVYYVAPAVLFFASLALL